ncbi:hypothetical protein SELMODRAFT_115388 [Selaginella moellendorffii]|uniref:Uncharacterized protein n=1 Tax=Selaginella moellendorffii TaxID=88036 RepID=D8SF10_SELML|nr:GDSL esterase/lipase At1g58430 [Selaginella moellendorffii]EFJ17076.1 hypothetical protein SELMODRAFT_115388 [Selaginella moellendorffii]|eukprot:XP_002981983.1 GDSL esterase/lipase At1g58430 [Selaginella moellendorffii]
MSSAILFCALLASTLSLVYAQSPNCTNATAVFTLGDSIVDSGNNNYFENVSFTIARANHTPYGVDYPNQIPTGRFTNGLVLPDYLAQYCGINRALPFLDPNANGVNLTQGVNLASGGAAIIDALSSNLTPYNFSLQIQWFANVTQRLQALEGVAAASARIARALFILSFGSNDFSNKNFSIYFNYTDADFRALMITTFSSRIKDLYNLGARKFIIPALGPLGCTPIAITIQCWSAFNFFPSCRTNCNENSNNLAYSYNVDLQTALNSLQANLTGSKFYFNFDAYNVTRDAISNPSNYGYTVVNRGCCGLGFTEIGDGCNGTMVCSPRSSYMFFDAIHPGQDLIKLLANRLFPSLAS